MKTNILLIEPKYPKIILDTTSIPLGLASIATVLHNRGYSVTCYDGSVDNFEEEIRYNDFNLIGIQFHSFEAIDFCYDLICRIKEKSNALIVVGGVAATLYIEYLRKNSDIDYIIPYEGENAFVNLVNAIENGRVLECIDGVISNNTTNYVANYPVPIFQKNIDSFPIPDRRFFRWEKYGQWSVITSRGCPFHCKFCTVPTFWRNTYRQRTPQNIFKEIKMLVEDFNATKIFILDDSFTVSKSRTMELLNMIIDNHLEIEWACLTRADLVDNELLFLMKKSGCSTISIGVESANQDTLDYLNKGLELKDIENAITSIKENNIRLRCSFIFGFPNETPKHLENNISFLKAFQPDEIQIYPLFPYFGTELNRNNELGEYDYSIGKDALNPIFETKYLTRETIKRYVKECVKEMQGLGYTWLSSHSCAPNKHSYNKTIMTEFAPIQALEKY